MIFPDGTRVLASGWLQRKKDDRLPDFGLYLDPHWTPTWPAVMLDWADFGVPSDRVAVDRATYCRRAVQEPAQQYWIERFSERVGDSG